MRSPGEEIDDVDPLLDNARRALAALSPKPQNSLRQTIVMLRPEILHARNVKKQSWKAIAETLADVEIDISAETLRVYIARAAPTRAARASRAHAKPTPAPLRDPLITGGDESKVSALAQEGQTEATSHGTPVTPRRLK